MEIKLTTRLIILNGLVLVKIVIIRGEKEEKIKQQIMELNLIEKFLKI
jgi:hypothetical protein